MSFMVTGSVQLMEPATQSKLLVQAVRAGASRASLLARDQGEGGLSLEVETFKLTFFRYTPGQLLRSKQADPSRGCHGLASVCEPCLRQGAYL